jgi:hypothetical protein
MSDGCDGACLPLIPEPPVPAGVVVFDYARWSVRYPGFTTSPELAQELFYDATMYVDNSPQSPVCDASLGGERERLLYLMTAHLAFLAGGGPGAGGAGAAAGTVGRPASKSVGPVSISYSLDGLPGGAAWYAQTQYGLTFWQLTAPYRTFRYRAPGIYPRAWHGYSWASGGLAYPWP